MNKLLPTIITVAILCTACTQSTKPTPAYNPTPSTGTSSSVAIGAVEGTKDTPANGIVQIKFFDDITVVKTEINILPEEGYYYQAWLTDATESTWLPVGALRSRTRDARHATNFETKEDLRSYNQLRVSMQQIGTDATTDKIVANATIIQR